jgi:NAD(P)H-dependent FMN reductase
MAGDIMASSPHVVGVGGSLRVGSTSRTALATVLEGATAAGARCRLIWVRDLDLPLYNAARPRLRHSSSPARHTGATP